MLFQTVLGAFNTSKASSLREAGAGALWEISQTNPASKAPAKTDQSNGHVMISYQWEVQDRMVHLKEALVKAGYNVWMDVDKAGRLGVNIKFNALFVIFFQNDLL